jgi:hypothetical protein
MVFYWLIDSSSSAFTPSADVEIFPREVKNIKHDRYFPPGLERSNPHENYPDTRQTQQVALVCGRLNSMICLYYQNSDNTIVDTGTTELGGRQEGQLPLLPFTKRGKGGGDEGGLLIKGKY